MLHFILVVAASRKDFSPLQLKINRFNFGPCVLHPVQICKVIKICKIHEKYLVMQMTWNNSRLTSDMHFVHKTLVNQQILLENLN